MRAKQIVAHLFSGWIFVTVLASCGSDPEVTSARGDEGNQAGLEGLSYLTRAGPLLLRPPDNGDRPGAEVSGQMDIEGECMALLMDRDQRALIVWPDGTTWDDELGEVQVDDDLTFADGDRLVGSGAYVEEGPGEPNEWDREILAQVDAMAATCGPLDLAVSVYPLRRERPKQPVEDAPSP